MLTLEQRREIWVNFSKSFPAEAIERTRGSSTGKGYDTTGIKYIYVTQRLNEVVGIGGWTTQQNIAVTTTKTKSGRDVYVATCDLHMFLLDFNADGRPFEWAKTFGVGGHQSFTEADARKGAFTNAVKKAAANFGVGYQAYAGTLDDDATPAIVEPATTELSPEGQELLDKVQNAETMVMLKSLTSLISKLPDQDKTILRSVYAKRAEMVGN